MITRRNLIDERLNKRSWSNFGGDHQERHRGVGKIKLTNGINQML